MKRLFLLLAVFTVIIFGGCCQNSPCYKNELISSSWRASMEGGAEISLDFEDDEDDLFADLIIKNAGKTCEISGTCLADEKSFVIFDKSVSQNYAFDYTPKGKTLDLSYNGSAITLQKNV